MQEQRKPDIRCPVCGSLARMEDRNTDQWRCRKDPKHIFFVPAHLTGRR